MRQVTDWEKTLASHIFDKDLVFITSKEISNLIIRKFCKNPIMRWLKDMWMTNKHIKTWSTSLIFKEYKLKLKYHCISNRISKIKDCQILKQL